ncbi:hypothetical protein RhiirB3_522974 [Rhizophagus irregularis]|nr:hypothetical protein RhiirB3_522974 [Rhizophagus irregularis]
MEKCNSSGKCGAIYCKRDFGPLRLVGRTSDDEGEDEEEDEEEDQDDGDEPLDTFYSDEDWE